MTTCNSQTEREKRTGDGRLLCVPNDWNMFFTTVPLKVECSMCELWTFALNDQIFPNRPESSCMRSISRFAKPKCQFRLFRKTRFSARARRRSLLWVGRMLTADSNVLHASGYTTTRRFYKRHDLEMVITHEKVFKWVLSGLNEEEKKVKQESMPMARWRFFVTSNAASRFRSPLQDSR